MKTPIYALEELPNLIGERQYKMLCQALHWPVDEIDMPDGEEFARSVQRKAFEATQRAIAETDQLAASATSSSFPEAAE